MTATRKLWMVAWAAAMVVGAASTARAGNALSLTPSYLDDTTTAPAETAPADNASQPGLLMQGLTAAGAGDMLSKLNLTFTGYVQGSWTHSLSDPSASTITDRGFDFENDKVLLNGVALDTERAVDASQGKYDVGFRLDMLYGSDARFTHSNGMFDNRGFAFSATQDGDTGPQNQFDITQAYLEFALPWGNGVKVVAGKFITPIGYEYVDPTKNTLYSHGYLFNFGAPFSQTGITAQYALSPVWNVMAGVTRGWDQSLKDNNGAVDFLGQVEFKPNDQWDTYLTLSIGPQESVGYGYRTELDGLATYTMNDKWTFGGEAMYGIESNVPGTTDDYSQWYGAAVYPSYKICPHLSINGRVEWFNDADGVRGVGANNAFEATLGVTILPLLDVKSIGSAFKIRPEIRYDYADSPVFDGGTSYSQTTFAVDAVLGF